LISQKINSLFPTMKDWSQVKWVSPCIRHCRLVAQQWALLLLKSLWVVSLEACMQFPCCNTVIPCKIHIEHDFSSGPSERQTIHRFLKSLWMDGCKSWKGDCFELIKRWCVMVISPSQLFYQFNPEV
jgi:hypothetical protein